MHCQVFSNVAIYSETAMFFNSSQKN